LLGPRSLRLDGRPQLVSRLAAGHPEGLALTPTRTTSRSGRGSPAGFCLGLWGLLAESACRCATRGRGCARGLVTAGPCVRLERIRWS